MKFLYKNWFVHNVIAHTLMYFVNLFNEAGSMKIHNGTLPEEV